MKAIDVVYFDAGGGHRSAATALQFVARQQRRPWEVRLVHLQEVLDSLDIVRKITGRRTQDIYNLMLRNGWTLGSAHLARLMQALIRHYRPRHVEILSKYWKEKEPSLVVSVVPHFNRTLFESVRQAGLQAPFVTILTDLADYPPHFWVEAQEQFFICGSGRAVGQARALGVAEERIFAVSGMIIHPRFYEQKSVERSAEKERLTLRKDLPTGLLLFGGQGSKAMLQIVGRLNNSDLNLQLIAVCGRNARLQQQLRNMKCRFPLHVEGFTLEVPYYMAISDFFIGKPGPGSISEALLMGLPVIVERNAWTLPQERYNADWILEKQAGLVVRDFQKIDEAVKELLSPENLRRFQANAGALRSRAVFEIPDLLARLM